MAGLVIAREGGQSRSQFSCGVYKQRTFDAPPARTRPREIFTRAKEGARGDPRRATWQGGRPAQGVAEQSRPCRTCAGARRLRALQFEPAAAALRTGDLHHRRVLEGELRVVRARAA